MTMQHHLPYVAANSAHRVGALHTAARQRTHQIAQPRCSVIVCTYNRCNLVLSTLASLRRQTLPYRQFEVIVVDNGSRDGTTEAVYRYVHAGIQQRAQHEHWRVRCLTEPQNGLAYARNRGLQAATGEIVVFLDDDSLADPHMLERLLAAYAETDADAIAAHVSLRWEAPRPHWLTDDLLDLLGFFAPAQTRMPLADTQLMSSCCFSIRRTVLQAVGGFTPLLSKRLYMPITGEMNDLCQRLRQGGYSIWHDARAHVSHRVVAARLQRAYFVGRAYWQGRSEVILHHIACRSQTEMPSHVIASLRSTLFPLLYELIYIACLLRPLLFCAGKSTNERLLAAMAQARCWGQIRQHVQFFNHSPLDGPQPTILLVQSEANDVAATLLAGALRQQAIACQSSGMDISFSWLWRHRAYEQQSIGILHFYRPGAAQLTYWQRQRMRIQLWLAHRWGVRVVSSDIGGWWQNVRTLRFRHQRSFERMIFAHSDLILSTTRQPAQLYPEPLRPQVRSLPQPGFRGYIPPPVKREQAYQQLGLPSHLPCVFLCFASQHTERELLTLLDAFQEVSKRSATRLILVGRPRDAPQATQMLKRVALNSAVHLFLRDPEAGDIALYMGAAHAVVLPYGALQQAGSLELATLALSYERVVVVPRLPRLHGMLPAQASIYFEAGSRASLTQALLKAHTTSYQPGIQDALLLDAQEGWKRQAQRLKDFYQQLINTLEQEP